MLKFFQKLKWKRQKINSFHSLLKGSSVLKAQGYQDLFALISNDFKRDGFFVEFGAANGKDLSNTWVLEKIFGWEGILAEPGRNWHQDLFKNRNCIISTDCVWTVSGEVLSFLESSQPELSTIHTFAETDGRNRLEKVHSTYEVNTISLLGLLQKYDAPSTIDFMSIDTEGSEFDILNNFDWSRYKINSLCIEHNNTNARQKIYELLVGNGYKRVYEGISGADDWYKNVS